MLISRPGRKRRRMAEKKQFLIAPVIARKLSRIPAAPGVYIMKGAGGEVIYIGKALSLRNRVRSYFGRSRSRGDSRPAAIHLAAKARDVEFIVTANENEAFILENNLIKKFKPRYNIRLRDDKTFLSLKVDLSHSFPTILPVRRMRKDGALYFGPYTSSRAIRSTLRFLRTVAPCRVCSDREFRNRSRPCIQYQIKRCSGPCCGLVTGEAYRADLEVALRVLRGEVAPLQEELKVEMTAAAERMEFEAAARLRDRISHLERFTATQKVESVRFDDADVIGYCREGGGSEVVVLFYREGKLLASTPYSFDMELDAEELLLQFVLRYYGERRHVPREIFLPLPIPDMTGVRNFLRARRKGAVVLRAPKRGEAAGLVAMAQENARLSLRASRGVRQIAAGIAESLRRSIGLVRAPIRIEGVDISNTGGGEPVGAIVHFKEGEPLKSRYRRFRVKTVEGADDFAMMREVLLRRFRRGAVEGDLPDLLLVDGGAAHVTAAAKIAGEIGVGTLEIVGMAKGDSRARAVADWAYSLKEGGKGDRVFLPGRATPVDLPAGSEGMHLLQRVRDEAHRFAVTYHRGLRRRKSIASPLEKVPGLGVLRRRNLMTLFGGMRGLRAASREDILKVDGIGPVLADRIVDAIRRGGSDERFRL
jgi:excinuclease ABC subunit C